MASGPITSWEIDGETVETVSDLFWGSKITADGDCSHEIKRRLLLGRKVMTNLKSILKSRDITLPTKVHLVKAMVFPVVMYGCESWTVKKAEHQKLMLLNCGVGEDSWESLGLQGDPTSPSWRRSVLGVHWKDWCWSWNSSTLATLCEELTHWKRPWCWEGLGAGGEGDGRGWDGWMASSTWWAWVWVNSRSLWWTGTSGVLQFMVSQRVGHDWATELNWTELIMMIRLFILRSVYGKEKSLQIPVPWKVLRKGEAKKMFSLVWRVYKRIPWGKKQNPKPNNNKHQKPLKFFFSIWISPYGWTQIQVVCYLI